MPGVLWLSNVETSEPVGIPFSRVTFIEQRPLCEANIVAIHLDCGIEIRVMEDLSGVRARIEALTGD